MDEIIRSVKDIQADYNMGDRLIQILCYADDAVPIAEDEDSLQRLLYRFANTVSAFNMLISTEKTYGSI